MNQSNTILEYLKKGYSLTPLEALEKFGCMRLGARIWDLHAEGYDIRSDIVKVENGKHYARYYLIQKEAQKEFNYQEAIACQS